MASVNNVEVFGLWSSIYRSGYPMMDHIPSSKEFHDACIGIADAIQAFRETGCKLENPHIRRAIKLAQAKGGGHDQFLTGIVVNYDLTFSNKAWVEAERYTFLNFISSMSTMHRISLLPIEESCNDYVLPEAAMIAERLQREYNELDAEAYPEKKRDAYLKLLYNIPAGFELTAGMTTNYRSLKNQYAQREKHRLPDWREVYCPWIKTLPLASYLITMEDKLQ